MASQKLSNYLRTYRKRLGLTQTEVAFLLGWGDPSQPSRYEQFSRLPSLRTALSLSVIVQVPVEELFSGEYQRLKKAVCRRAQRLEARLNAENPDRRTARKLASLKCILSPGANPS